MHINGQTRLVAVLGHPVAHTASPAMHNAAFEALDLNWVYVALDVHPHHLRTTLQGLGKAGFVGANLTMPHKILVMNYLDRADPIARELCATNTVRFSHRAPCGAW